MLKQFFYFRMWKSRRIIKRNVIWGCNPPYKLYIYNKDSQSILIILFDIDFGKFNCYLIVLSGTILATTYLETVSISFVLPLLECDMNFTTAQRGVLSAASFSGKYIKQKFLSFITNYLTSEGMITSAYLWGFLADLKGRRAIIIPTLLLSFLCSFLSSLSPNFWFMATLRYLTGFL